MLKIASMIFTALATLALTNPAAAQDKPSSTTNQTQSIKRIPLQRFDVPGTAYETVIGIAEMAPNVSIGRHTHPGPESGYVIQGGFELLIDGEPPRPVKAGESYQLPARTVHDARSGAEGAKVIATYIIEKGQPLATTAK
jgi:quercetin dioxygenase-like cupin family protein